MKGIGVEVWIWAEGPAALLSGRGRKQESSLGKRGFGHY